MMILQTKPVIALYIMKAEWLLIVW